MYTQGGINKNVYFVSHNGCVTIDLLANRTEYKLPLVRIWLCIAAHRPPAARCFLPEPLFIVSGLGLFANIVVLF